MSTVRKATPTAIVMSVTAVIAGETCQHWAVLLLGAITISVLWSVVLAAVWSARASRRRAARLVLQQLLDATRDDPYRDVR